MNIKTPTNTQSAFQLKGSVLTLSVLQLLTLDYDAFKKQLANTVRKNPSLFNQMPVIIDLQKLYALDNAINFAAIHLQLREHGLVPVGITNANLKQIAAATEVGLGVLPNVKTNSTSKATKKIEYSKIITQPVRSGQQLYAKESDLIILASVSNGAEILADGSIHIYGTLRGRAIAGANGETQARIFCQKLEKPELVAIAGHYKLQEEIDTASHACHTQIFLENGELVIAPIT